LSQSGRKPETEQIIYYTKLSTLFVGQSSVFLALINMS